MRVDSEPAFVLHARPYRETSQLVDLFSRHHGRFRAVARGFRQTKTSTKTLSLFTPLLIDWTGKSDLKTLVGAEQTGVPLMLTGDRLFSGFYLNELLLRLLAEHDPHEWIFDCYLEIMNKLADGDQVEPALRQFETCLLEGIGYALVLDTDAESGEPVAPDLWYWFDPTVGLVARPSVRSEQRAPNWFQGEELIAIDHGDDSNPSIGQSKKRLMRLALLPHLGGKPLRSRELFRH
ncbi:MAG: DNA repair protein RecO [Porticoccus sp.]